MQSISRYFCGLARLIESTKFEFIIHFGEFPTVSGREKDLQLHLDTANYLGGATRKNLDFKILIENLLLLFLCLWLLCFKTFMNRAECTPVHGTVTMTG